RVGGAAMGSVVARLPSHLGDPAQAWPASARPLFPGPIAFYGTLASIAIPVASGLAFAWTRKSARRCGTARGARGAHARDLRTLIVNNHVPGRLSLGRVQGRLVAAEARQSALVVGPTQTGKTTGFAIPAILEWRGPVVATSIKTDLLRETLAARAAHP